MGTIDWKDWYQLWNLWKQGEDADDMLALTKEQWEWQKERADRDPKIFAPPEQAKAYDMAGWAKYQGDLDTRTHLRKQFGKEGGIFDSMATNFNNIGKGWTPPGQLQPSQGADWKSMMGQATGMGPAGQWDPNSFNDESWWNPPELANQALDEANKQFTEDGWYTPMGPGPGQGGNQTNTRTGGNDDDYNPDEDIAPRDDLWGMSIYEYITNNPGVSPHELSSMFPESHSGPFVYESENGLGYIWSPAQNAWINVPPEQVQQLKVYDDMFREALTDIWDFVKTAGGAAMAVGYGIISKDWVGAGAKFLDEMGANGINRDSAEAMWAKIKEMAEKFKEIFNYSGNDPTNPPNPPSGNDGDPDPSPDYGPR